MSSITINSRNIESLYVFVEHIKQQQDDAKKQLQQHIVDTVDDLFGGIVTGLMIWASSIGLKAPNKVTLPNGALQSPQLSPLPSSVPQTQIPQTQTPSTSIVKASSRIASRRLSIKKELIEDDEVDKNSQANEHAQDRTINFEDFDNEEECECPECQGNQFIKEEVIGIDDDEVDSNSDEDEEEYPKDGIISQISETSLEDSSSPPKKSKQSILSQGSRDSSFGVLQQQQPSTSDTNYHQIDIFELEDDENEIEFFGDNELDGSFSQQQLSNHSKSQSFDKEKESSNRNSRTRLSKSQIIQLRCAHSSNCDGIFYSREEHAQHMTNVHDIGPYQCYHRNCNLSFGTCMELSLHLRVFHEHTTEWECALCSRHFKEHDGLSNHMLHNHHLGLFACTKEDCNFTASFQCEVQRHFVQTHCKFTCPFPRCGKSFSYKNVLETHQRSHIGLKPYRCRWPEGCYFACSDRSSIVKHIRTQHFKLPKSKKAQREMNIVDNRNVNDYINVVMDEQQSQHVAPISPQVSTSQAFLSHQQGSSLQHNFNYNHLLSKRLKMKLFRCKWEGCDYASEHKHNVLRHIRAIHSIRHHAHV